MLFRSRRDDTGEGVVHLYNISFARGINAAAAVSLRWPDPISTLTRIGYDMDETPVVFKIEDGVARFNIDCIKESAVVIINKK